MRISSNMRMFLLLLGISIGFFYLYKEKKEEGFRGVYASGVTKGSDKTVLIIMGSIIGGIVLFIGIGYMFISDNKPNISTNYRTGNNNGMNYRNRVNV